MSHAQLAALSRAHKQGGDFEHALAYDRHATVAYPGGVAWHNLAATLSDLGRAREAAKAIRRAFACGADSADTWYLNARIAAARGRAEEAEAAFLCAAARNPRHLGAALSLARLRWMLGADLERASAPLKAGLRSGAPRGALIVALGRLFDAAGRSEFRRRLIDQELKEVPHDASLLLSASDFCLDDGDASGAVRLARQAVRVAGAAGATLTQLAASLSAAGEPEAALGAAMEALSIDPHNQAALCWAHTAARLCAGDSAACPGMPYGVFEPDPPTPFTCRDVFLDSLARHLRTMHRSNRAPFDQSIVGGLQSVQDLRADESDVVCAFWDCVRAPIEHFVASLGTGTDSLRRRARKRWRVAAAWSVALRPGGRHVSHFHSAGWLSAVFYVEAPSSGGALEFGATPFSTSPLLPPWGSVIPRAGRLVVFPSYCWHRTAPAETSRLTIAFDIVPA